MPARVGQYIDIIVILKCQDNRYQKDFLVSQYHLHNIIESNMIILMIIA